MAARTPTITANATSTADTDTLTCNFGGTATSGHRIVVIAAHSDDFPATPAGYTLDSFDAGAGVVSFFSKQSDGTETSVTVTAPSGGAMAIWVGIYSDLGAHTDSGTGMSNGTGAIGSGTITVTADDEIFAGFAIRSPTLPTSGTWGGVLAGSTNAFNTSGSANNLRLVVANYTSEGAGVSDTYSYTPGGTTTSFGQLNSYAPGDGGGDPEPDPDQLATPTVSVTASTNPTTTGGSDGTITVSWDAVTNADTYEVGIADGLDQTDGFTQVTADATSPYQITGLSAGDYTVGVKAHPAAE